MGCQEDARPAPALGLEPTLSSADSAYLVNGLVGYSSLCTQLADKRDPLLQCALLRRASAPRST